MAAAKAVTTFFPDMSYETALDIAKKSHDEHGYSAHLFIRDHGLDYPAYHEEFHHHVDEKIIARNDAMIGALGRLALPHVIVTHASREWAERVLGHLGLIDFFPAEKIIALEDTEFAAKSKSPQAV